VFNNRYVHRCTLWRVSSGEIIDSHIGSGTLSTPPELLWCQWDNTVTEFIDKLGTSYRVKSKVFINADVSIGDYLYFGESSSEKVLKAADPVQGLKRINSVNGRYTSYCYYL